MCSSCLSFPFSCFPQGPIPYPDERPGRQHRRRAGVRAEQEGAGEDGERERQRGRGATLQRDRDGRRRVQQDVRERERRPDALTSS